MLVGFATLAGMRSMSAPALLSHYLTRNPSWLLLSSPLRALQKPLVARGLKLAAAGEMMMDKLPGTPNRIAPPVLLGRLLAGALVGAAVYKSREGSSAAGAADRGGAVHGGGAEGAAGWLYGFGGGDGG